MKNDASHLQVTHITKKEYCRVFFYALVGHKATCHHLRTTLTATRGGGGGDALFRSQKNNLEPVVTKTN